MRKKLLTLAMSAVMSVSTVISAFAAETLTGTAWWEGKQVGKDYAIPEEGSLTLVVESKIGSAEDAFSVEVYKAGTDNNDGYFFTTGTDGNAWLAESLLNNGTVKCPYTDNGSKDPGKFVSGHTYEVTVTRSQNSIVVDYYDVTDKKEMYKMSAECTLELPKVMNVHVMAQIGTITVDVKSEEATKDNKNSKDESKADESESKTTTKVEDIDEDGMDPMVIVVVSVVAIIVIAGIVVATKKKD